MSTKTTIKRIALVAASALAIGGFSAVSPANAAVNDGLLAYINKSTTVNVAGAGAVALSTGQTGVSYTGNGAIANSVASLTVPAGAVIAFKVTAGNGGTWAAGSEARISANGALVTTKACTIATVTCTLANYTAPSTAGTYNMQLIMSGDAGSYAVADVETISFTLTVSALSDFSAGRTTVYIADGATAATSTTDALGASGVKDSGTQAANIKVTLARADNSAYDVGTVYAYMTGPGMLDMTADHTDLNGDTATDVRSDSLASDAEFNIAVTGDGTSGVGTVNMYIILADGVTKVTLPSKTVTFYGSVASIKVEQNYKVVKPAGATTGYTGTTPGATDVAAVVISAQDSNGVDVCGVTGLSALSSDTSVLATSTITEDDGAGDGSVGACKYIGQITSGANSASGKTATLTFRHLVAGSTTTYYTAPALTFTIGSSTPKTVVLSLDKTSYAPGEKATLTATLKDSAGNVVSDGSHAAVLDAGLSSSAAIQGLTTSTAISTLSGVKTWTIYAPVSGGEFTITGALGTGVATGASLAGVTASVEGDQASSLALDAANAATDAANNAYDEAQNATQAASDALAAVTALAAQVKSLIASVKKLTAAVAKLKK